LRVLLAPARGFWTLIIPGSDFGEQANLTRYERKDYVVQEDEILLIRFSV
jgi:hypothetical protein